MGDERFEIHLDGALVPGPGSGAPDVNLHRSENVSFLHLTEDGPYTWGDGTPFTPRVELACNDGVVLRVNRPDGSPLAEVCDDGRIRLHGNPTEAATIFWTAVADAIPAVRKRLLSCDKSDDEDAPVEFDPADLQWDTFRYEHDRVDYPPSGLRLTHKPTGVQIATTGSESRLAKMERLLDRLRAAASVQPDGSILIDANA